MAVGIGAMSMIHRKKTSPSCGVIGSDHGDETNHCAPSQNTNVNFPSLDYGAKSGNN
jgi:hypothetical protein